MTTNLRFFVFPHLPQLEKLLNTFYFSFQLGYTNFYPLVSRVSISLPILQLRQKGELLRKGVQQVTKLGLKSEPLDPHHY